MGAAKCPSKGTQKIFRKNVFRLWKFCRPRLDRFTINTELFENLVSVNFGQGRFCWREQQKINLANNHKPRSKAYQRSD